MAWLVAMSIVFLLPPMARAITMVQASSLTIDPACAAYLVALVRYLQIHPPIVVPPAPIDPQSLVVAAWCSSDPAQSAWRITNPNPFDLVIGWGWADQAPVLVEDWVVVPAAHAGIPGSGTLITPANGDLRVVSGATVGRI